MTKKPNPKDGAPRWTYTAAAVVAIGTLAWAIFTYLMPKSPLMNAPDVASAPKVTVSGTGNVGVGTMSGGQISLRGPVPPEPPASTPPKIGNDP